MSKTWIVLLVILAITSLGCMGSDKTEGTIKTGDGEFDYSISGDSEDEWCAAGSSFKMSDPSTGEIVSWEVTGTEVIDAIEMCKMVITATDGNGDIFKTETYHSQDDSIIITITYDSSGNVVNKMTLTDNSMIMEDGDGNIISEYTN
jgi:hypothetical protein